MDDFAELPAEEKLVYIEQGSLRLGLAQTVVEKDYWVCWLLRKLFSLPNISGHLIFKGGTSLSKIFGLIQRFSEDIDVSIDREFLGFQGETDPLTIQSRTARDRCLEKLQTACIEAVRDKLMPTLNEAIGRELKDGWKLTIDKQDPLSVLFHFPSALRQGAFTYITPYVKVELGARGDHWPQERKPIRSYLSETFSEQLKEEASTALTVLAAERTFWEKATILHAEYYRPEAKSAPERLSRHYYDLHALCSSPVGERSVADLALLDRVAAHKQVFFRSSWARYEEAKPGTLRLLPPTARSAALKADYQRMRDMFFSEPPALDTILESLEMLETQINGSGSRNG